ncbi:helix-turn-helix domain-containing protein [Lysobacter sp. cf310]|uniref:helix-turn-helix domain-containing protein n=1 Tax=Lysobacter sp. cf310 TaxID=1761790 RepID=UPI0008EF7C7F|nr:helix-turn-helix transcriptional regulator [Lysobacter sp. cf310]SFL21235.1 Cro/C1-type HTH DNA-binding domain-containing protein [Lysobacter sp. cf310]
MAERERVLAALKAVLKQRGWRYADLARELGVSEPTVKRLLSSGRIDLERLERICALLDLDFFELARLARGARDAPRHLSERQEAELAQSPRLMTVFHLLCQGWRADAIREGYALGAPELTRLLARLDRLGLVELLPGDRVRLRVPRDFSWRDDGPVRARYLSAASREFLLDEFRAPDTLLALEIRELGAASLAVLRRKLERLQIEFKEAAELDISLPPSKRRSVGILVAMRPWVYSLIDSLRSEYAGREPAAAARGRKSGRKPTVG